MSSLLRMPSCRGEIVLFIYIFKTIQWICFCLYFGNNLKDFFFFLEDREYVYLSFKYYNLIYTYKL